MTMLHHAIGETVEILDPRSDFKGDAVTILDVDTRLADDPEDPSIWYTVELPNGTHGLYRHDEVKLVTRQDEETVAESENVQLTAYLAGPISNSPDWQLYFNDAAARLREAGYAVLNPAEYGEDVLPREEYMAKDFARILQADVIYLLPGWEDSRGALVEFQVALEAGKPIYYLDGAFRGEPVELVASKLVRNGERERDYGHPYGDMNRFTILLTGLFADYLKPDVGRIPTHMGPLVMLLLKANRLVNNPTHEDSRTDLLGWGIVYDRVMQRLGNGPAAG